MSKKEDTEDYQIEGVFELLINKNCFKTCIQNTEYGQNIPTVNLNPVVGVNSKES